MEQDKKNVDKNVDKNFRNKMLKSLDEIKTFSLENLNILNSQKEKLNDCETKLNNINDDLNLSKTLINSMSGASSYVSLDSLNPISNDLKNLNNNFNKFKIKNKINIINKKIHKIKETINNKISRKDNTYDKNGENEECDKNNKEDDDFDLILQSIKEIKKYNKAINSEMDFQNDLIDKNIDKADINNYKLKNNIKKIDKIIDK